MRNSDRRFEVRRRLSLNQNFPFQNSSCILLKSYAILIFLYFVFKIIIQKHYNVKNWVGLEEEEEGARGGGFRCCKSVRVMALLSYNFYTAISFLYTAL